jgi:AraC-like DNA-binding protein
MRSLVFDSNDLGRTEEFLSNAYTKMQIGSSTERVRAQFVRDATATVSIDDLDIGFDMSYEADSLGRICLCVVSSGRIEDHDTGDWQDSLGPGDVAYFVPPDRASRGTVRRARYRIVMLEPELLSRVAAVPGGSSEPVRLVGHRPVSAAAGAHLADTITYLRDHVLSEPTIRDSDLIASTASQLLAAAVLNTFPSTASTEPAGSDRHDAHPNTVRRAVEFMESHLHADISAADIAEAAGVTVRAVQLAFRRHLGTTPMEYLRRIRLAEAHTTLRKADAASETVTSVAARWGFHHPGRFAAAYRAAYGLPPSTTLNT